MQESRTGDFSLAASGLCVSAQRPRGPALFATAEHWHRVAEADYRLCREFWQRFGARLHRSLRGQRVGWELYGHAHCGLLLPDADGAGGSDADEWYLYYPSGESLFRRTAAQRKQMGMLLLAESVDDWAELLRQALQEQVFDVRYQITPNYVSALGDVEFTASGFIFVLEANGPPAEGEALLRITGTGTTPEQAAREACRRWCLQDTARES